MTPSPAQDPRVQNANIRAALLRSAIPMMQEDAIPGVTLNSGSNTATVSGQVVAVTPRNVGLLRGIWIKVTATVFNNDGANALTLTDFGAANILSQIVFTDLQNNQRVNTQGWHLAMLNTIRPKRPYFSALTAAAQDISGIIGYGANWSLDSATTNIASGGNSGTVVMWYYLPIAYSSTDLRGAIYANVQNSQMQLALTINPQFAVTAASDTTFSVYKGTTVTAFIPTVTISFIQDYLDQIPQVINNGQRQPLLPLIDLSTIYELRTSTLNGLVVNQDNPIAYPNQRDFLSTVVIYNNSGGSAGRVVGADINRWKLTAANLTNIMNVEPNFIAGRTRQIIGTDLPKGVYYFDWRQRPISTAQFGNMQLMNNPATAGAAAYMAVGFEDFAIVALASSATSFPAAG